MRMNADNNDELTSFTSPEITKNESHRSSRRTMKMTNVLSCFGGVLFFTIVCVGAIYGFQENDKIDRFIDDLNLTVWTYEWKNCTCNRRLLKQNETPISLELCYTKCSFLSLWPAPTTVKLANLSESAIKKNLISLTIISPTSVKNDVNRAFKIFLNNLPNEDISTKQNVDLINVFIKINITKEELKPTLQTDESYHMLVAKEIDRVVANIVSNTYFGARHALETLSQLIWFDKISRKLLINHGIEIKDKPAFPHRGLMVDTSRNFFPIDKLLKVIDGMAANKLNVFHLHLTDSVSFPIVLPNNPWLAKYGAYSQDKMYKPEDIKELVEYARVRGIRVIMEIDSPSHVNEGWNRENTNTSKIVICGEDEVTNGHLNPDNPETFKLLESVYADLLQLGTDEETFHIGGDEVNLSCYETTKSAEKFDNIYDFWVDLNHKIFDTAIRAFNNHSPENLVIWSNDLTSSKMKDLKYVNNLVVQYWFGQLEPIIENGNKIIFSTVGNWYLDCGFGPWKSREYQGSCDPYTHWKLFYLYRPWESYTSYRNQFLGGEVCLWSEQVDVESLETRIWPRTAAFAERVWSDLPAFDVTNVVTRLSTQRERLIRRGFKAAALWPEWCTQHPGKC